MADERSLKVDSVLINPPVASPLHPQLNLPLLKSYLARHGFTSRIMDANLLFFYEFLQQPLQPPASGVLESNPLELLSYYNELERRLHERCADWPDLQVGLRSLGMRHDRIFFDSVIRATSDREGNPFIPFWDRFIQQRLQPAEPRLTGIAITFQDQIIPAFTLAARLRQLLPETAIVLGGQMITRCHPSMLDHPAIMACADFLALWDGEEPLLNIHKHLLRPHESVDFTNVIRPGRQDHVINRSAATPVGQIPSPDFSDLDFNAYLLPEPLIPLQTTRGCYANCAFCAIPFGSNKYQVRTAERVVEDILQVQELTLRQTGRKATYFKFMEDTSSPAVLGHLAELIRQRGIDAKWETFARLEKSFTRPGFLENLYRGGCRKIHWGLESNDPGILDRMRKNTELSCTDEILELAARAGILNFCFILLGFPGETDAMRENLTRYICDNPHIHTLTIATFDLTRNSPMEQSYAPDNPLGIQLAPASDFQVRLPYLVHGENWKSRIVPAAHAMMVEIIRHRPDIGFVTLFPDQIRALLCDRLGNDWGKRFVVKYGADNVRAMLL
ncbi:MAG: radical SAM protein, partial [Magnetococcales bacterium]|nr:radical SAM protein [Magnetococcales bacterium]